MKPLRLAVASLLLTGCQHYADGRDPPQCGLAPSPPAAEPPSRAVRESPPATTQTAATTTTEAPGRTQSHTPVVASIPAPAAPAPAAPAALSAPARADLQRLLVVSPKSSVVDAPTLSTLSAVIAAEVSQQQRFTVVGTEAIPGYRVNNAPCDLSCLGTMAAASNARFVVSGDVGRIGDLYVLTLALFDIDTGAFINRVNVQGIGIAALPPALPAHLQRLTAGVPDAHTGAPSAPSVPGAPGAPSASITSASSASSGSRGSRATDVVRSDLIVVRDNGDFGNAHARCEVMADRIECHVEAWLFGSERHGTWLYSQLRSIAKSSTGVVTITRTNGQVTKMELADLKQVHPNTVPTFAEVRQAETQLALAREWQEDLLTAWNAR